MGCIKPPQSNDAAIYAAVTVLPAEGARIGLASCRLCGAAILIDPREEFDATERHLAWHRERCPHVLTEQRMTTEYGSTTNLVKRLCDAEGELERLREDADADKLRIREALEWRDVAENEVERLREALRRILEDWPYQPPEVIEPEREAFLRLLSKDN